MSDSSNKKICSVCGEELDQKFQFCPGCGAAVQGIGSSNTENDEHSDSEIKNNKQGKSQKKKPNKSSTETNKKKNFSSANVLIIIFGLLLVALLINYAAGVFDTPDVAVIPQVQDNFNQNHKGASLQNLQQINDLEAKVKANPSDMASVLDLAHLLNDSGFKEKAINNYKIYLNSDPKNADVIVDMGVCYYELGNYDEAIKLMKQAISYQPNHQIAHLNLGIVTMTAGNHDEALKYWKKAVEINPNNEIGKRAQELINSH